MNLNFPALSLSSFLILRLTSQAIFVSPLIRPCTAQQTTALSSLPSALISCSCKTSPFSVTLFCSDITNRFILRPVTMAPTTRKRAQVNNNPQPISVVSAGADVVTAGGVTGRKYKDDDPFESVFDPLIDVPSDDHDSDHSDFGADSRKRKRKCDSDRKGKSKKRFARRAPPPPAVPDLSDDEYALNGNQTEEEEDGGLWSVERRAGTKKTNEDKTNHSQVLSIEVNSEGGVTTLINLNLADLLKNLGASSWTLSTRPRSEAAEIATEFPEDTTMVQNKRLGFLDLPLELRLKTYRLLFRDDKAIEFDRRDFSRSSHFLRTCKTVLQEGREVLYGENSFHFTRETAIRGRYYEKVWKEIGYKDVRRFFEIIGPACISHMKYISFVLTDGADNRTRTSTQIPERKFVNDPHLHQVFRIIGASATLRTLAIQFAGRGWVSNNDFHFLKALTEIKCYKFATIYRFRGNSNKCFGDLQDKMKQVMRVTDENGDEVDRPDSQNRVKMVYEGWNPVFPVMLHYVYDW
ncbi:hypothetical protein CLAIMM_09991 isoform 1 [Cladophialophora immunda]|nr:hypothetical protein CLAIMM_09991 isoform 1 [Cladophialophora immunda]